MSIKLTPAMWAALDAITGDVHAPGVKGVTLEALERRGVIRCEQHRDANGDALEFARWYLTDAGAAAQAKRLASAPVGPRSAVRVTEPNRPGNGTSRHWTRTLSGKRYSFTAVLMPSGERRYSVSRFDGPHGAPNFDYYWTRLHYVTVPAPAAEADPAEADAAEAAQRKAEASLTNLLDDMHHASITRREAARRAHDDYGTCRADAGDGVCGRPLDAYGRCDGLAGHWGGATPLDRVTAALSAMVADAQAKLTEAERRPAAEQDAELIAALSARCIALVDAYHLSHSEAPMSAASSMITVHTAEVNRAGGER
jgi:hypothetical protein